MAAEVFSAAPEPSGEPPATSSTNFVVIGLVVALVLVALFFVSQHFDAGAHHYDTAAAKQDLPPVVPTTAPPAVESAKFAAADAGIRVSFPGAPKRSASTFKVGSTPLTMIVYEDVNPDSEFAVGSMKLPAGTPVDLEAELQATAKLMGAEVGSSFTKTFEGHPAYEGVIAAGCGCNLVKAFMIIVRTDDRVVFAFGGADTNSEARYVAFRDSLEIV